MPIKEWLPEWVLLELQELRKALVGCVVLVSIGAFVGWYVTFKVMTWSYERQLITARERVEFAEKRLEEHASSPEVRPQTIGSSLSIIGAWGAGAAQRCAARLLRQNLSQYATTHDVALVCGVTRKNIDRFADEAITVSQKFGLEERSAVEVDAQSSVAMMKAFQESVEALKLTVQPPVRRGLVAVIPIWYEPILLPKHIKVSDIHSLLDVRRLGGIIPGDGRALGLQAPLDK